MNEENRITVEVAYAEPERQLIKSIDVAAGTSAQSAIQQSGILEAFPQIDLAVNHIGVFGRSIPLDATLQSGDRVEIYRPLQADPKEMRKQRAAQKKAADEQRRKA